MLQHNHSIERPFLFAYPCLDPAPTPEVASIRLRLESDLVETQREISTLTSVLASKERRKEELEKLLGKNAIHNFKGELQVGFAVIQFQSSPLGRFCCYTISKLTLRRVLMKHNIKG